MIHYNILQINLVLCFQILTWICLLVDQNLTKKKKKTENKKRLIYEVLKTAIPLFLLGGPDVQSMGW